MITGIELLFLVVIELLIASIATLFMSLYMDKRLNKAFNIIEKSRDRW